MVSKENVGTLWGNAPRNVLRRKRCVVKIGRTVVLGTGDSITEALS
jgi:hypothetical protein